MAFSLHLTERRYREYDVTVKNRQGSTVQLAGGVKAALVPRGVKPDASTVWVSVPMEDAVVLVLLAGPAATAVEGAFVIPVEGADLYFMYEDDPELEVDFVESLSVK